MLLPRVFRTSTFRLTAAYVALFSASAVLLFVIVDFSTQSYMTSELRAAVNSDLGELRQIYSESGNDGLIAEIDHRLRQDSNGPMFYLLQDPSGWKLAGNLHATEPVEGIFKLSSRQGPESLIGHDAYAHGVVLPDGYYLAVAIDAYPLGEMRELVIRAFGWSFVMTLLLGLGGGIFVSRRMLKRVESVSQASREIIGGNLSRRIPLRGTEDEFDHLSASLNIMLDRTQALMESIQQVSNDIAHDLRTPLTRLRQRLELSLRSGSAEDWRAALKRSIDDTDAILETFGALLRIAQIEAHVRKQNFSRVNLSEIVQSVAELHQPTCDERRQRLSIDIPPDLYVLGDRELLAQMLSNLIENAIRHSPEGSCVRLTARSDPRGHEVVLSDNGPGIPVGERSKVFRRFYRLETSRSTPGSGLGLSLVAAIAHVHGILIELGDNRPGLRVRLHFTSEPGAAIGDAAA